MRPNEVVELAMRRVYAAEAKNVVDLVAKVADAIQSSDFMELRYQFQRLIYADAKNGAYDIRDASSPQLMATALGYLILHHSEATHV